MTDTDVLLCIGTGICIAGWFCFALSLDTTATRVVKFYRELNRILRGGQA